jgi:hypothetical protein
MRKRGLILKIAIMVLLLFHTISYAQTQEVTNGLNYLYTVQNPDGSWNGQLYKGSLSTTSNTIEILSMLGQENSTSYINAVLWLQSQELDTTDYLSERIHALLVTGTDSDLLLSYMDELFKAWGGYEDYGVNTGVS